MGAMALKVGVVLCPGFLSKTILDTSILPIRTVARIDKVHT